MLKVSLKIRQTMIKLIWNRYLEKWVKGSIRFLSDHTHNDDMPVFRRPKNCDGYLAYLSQ